MVNQQHATDYVNRTLLVKNHDHSFNYKYVNCMKFVLLPLKYHNPNLIFVILCSTGLFELECLPAVGILAQTTVIRCFFKDIKDIQILGVYLTKAEEKDPFFHQDGSERSGDPRFSVENLEVGPSLQISDTTFSDEGKYRYRVVTDSGVKEIQLSISVTGEIQFL